MTTPPPDEIKPEPAEPPSEPGPSSTRHIPLLKKRGGLLDGLIAASIALTYAVILLRTTHDLGYARDEGFYFQAATAYQKWFELLLSNWRAAFDLKAVDASWAANNEHPALIKSLFALSHLVLHKKLHLFGMEGTSFRFPAICLASAGVALVYFWGAQARSRLAGLVAAALLAAMPRFFYHAHLACFDAPIVTMWMLCAYCYWRALRTSGALWPVLCGLAFGLALDTKHNAWFLPFAFTAHAALVEIRRRFLYAGAGASLPQNREGKRAVIALACMAVLGPIVLYALWPWLWRDPIGRFRNYALFHLLHDYYNMEFLGRNYWTPPMPRSYAWLMTAATVPIVTLALALAGLVARARASFVPPLVRAARLLNAWRKRAESPPAPAPPSRAHVQDEAASTDLLWFLGVAVAYAPWLLSADTPIFGGTKHWMTAYPFLVLFAGAGFCNVVAAARRAVARASQKRPRLPEAARRRLFQVARAPWIPALLAACVLVAPVVETARSHPWGLSSYTPLVGGAAGAATIGLNRTFWGYTTGAVADYLNREVRKGGTVYIHDTAGQAWDMMVRDGRIRKDIRASWTISGSDFGLYHHELHMQGQEHQNWVAFDTVAPAHIGGLDGVPVILVYKRPTAPAPPPR